MLSIGQSKRPASFIPDEELPTQAILTEPFFAMPEDHGIEIDQGFSSEN